MEERALQMSQRDAFCAERNGSETLAAADHERSAAELRRRFEDLIAELMLFQTYLKNQKKEDQVSMGTFHSGMQTELRLLNKVLTADCRGRRKAMHAVKSSNFPFYDAVWGHAKRCENLTALRKRFYFDGREKQIGQNLPTKNMPESVLIDIVSEGGQQWTKVSTLSERRIVFDLAKAGWVESSSDADEEGGDENLNPPDQKSDGLLKQIQCLIKASRANKSNYRWPEISLVLTRINHDCQKPVAGVLDKIRALGVTVITSEEIHEPPHIDKILQHMAVDHSAGFSDVLNFDCTILLAFVSDLSHGQVKPQDWHHNFLGKQRESEKKTPLLSDILWPACGSRKLVCTHEAATRMQEIVEEIGTSQERIRAALLLGYGHYRSLGRQQRTERFQQLSGFQVPKAWNIPVETVEYSSAAVLIQLPPVAQDLVDSLSPLNQSVFLYGWASKRTTISSNRITAKAIKGLIERKAHSEEIIGPDIWLSPMSRSLAGKENRQPKE